MPPIHVERDDVPGLQTLARGQSRRDRQVVVPNHFRQRLRQFLQPRIIGRMTGPERRIRPDHHRQPARRRLRRHRRDRRDRDGRQPGMRHDAALQHRLPSRRKHLRRGAALVMEAHQVARLERRHVHQQRHDLARRPAVVQRADRRLPERDGPVRRPCIAPRLERMLQRQMPVAPQRRLVRIQPGVDPQLHLLQ